MTCSVSSAIRFTFSLLRYELCSISWKEKAKLQTWHLSQLGILSSNTCELSKMIQPVRQRLCTIQSETDCFLFLSFALLGTKWLSNTSMEQLSWRASLDTHKDESCMVKHPVSSGCFSENSTLRKVPLLKKVSLFFSCHSGTIVCVTRWRNTLVARRHARSFDVTVLMQILWGNDRKVIWVVETDGSDEK